LHALRRLRLGDVVQLALRILRLSILRLSLLLLRLLLLFSCRGLFIVFLQSFSKSFSAPGCFFL
ncbi:MAG: hypothetical protein LUE08_01685, partial [Akkermansiaceae bacterium]|nr:hypothetical protein [Akkermansiaceae bacterium]